MFSKTKTIKKPDSSAELTVHRKNPELWIVEKELALRSSDGDDSQRIGPHWGKIIAWSHELYNCTIHFHSLIDNLGKRGHSSINENCLLSSWATYKSAFALCIKIQSPTMRWSHIQDNASMFHEHVPNRLYPKIDGYHGCLPRDFRRFDPPLCIHQKSSSTVWLPRGSAISDFCRLPRLPRLLRF